MDMVNQAGCLFVCCFLLVHRAACRILVSQPGIDPMLPAVEHEALTSGLPWKSQAGL